MIYKIEELDSKCLDIYLEIKELKNKIKDLEEVYHNLKPRTQFCLDIGNTEYDIYSSILYNKFHVDLFKGKTLDQILQGKFFNYEKLDDCTFIWFRSDYPLESFKALQLLKDSNIDYTIDYLHIYGEDILDYIEECNISGTNELENIYNLVSKVELKSEDWYKLNELCTGIEGLKLVKTLLENYNNQ